MRKYGTDKPDLRNPIEMQAVTEHFAGSGFKVFAGMIENDPKVEVWAIPAKTGGQPRLLRPDELLGAGRGPAGPRLHLLAQGRRNLEGAGPIAKNIGPERTEAIRPRWAWKMAMPASSPPATRKSSPRLPAMRATRAGARN
jgi:aspartyl-tRNA synthetase